MGYLDLIMKKWGSDVLCRILVGVIRGFVMEYSGRNHLKLEIFQGDIHWKLANQLDMILGCA